MIEARRSTVSLSELLTIGRPAKYINVVVGSKMQAAMWMTASFMSYSVFFSSVLSSDPVRDSPASAVHVVTD